MIPDRPRLIAAGILLLVLVAYIPALRAGFIWDDDSYVTENETLRSLEGLKRIWFEPRATPQYYPLVHTTFWIEYHLWGLRPFGYHLINVLLHALNACLFWLILRQLHVPGAPVAALLFALHPVHVESVAWVTERKNLLSGAFYLAAALAYLRTERRRWLLVGGLFLGALLSKTVTATLPAALALIEWWKKGRVSGRELLPLFTLGAGMGLLTAWIEKHHVGATLDLSAIERILVAGRALWFYASKLILPVQLSFIYPRWNIDAAALWQFAFPVGAVGVIAVLWFLRRRWGRGPLVAVLFFAGTLFPALGFVDVYPFRFSFVADHFQYLASLGLLALAAGTRHRAAGMIGLAVAVFFGILTWSQARDYKDQPTLWRATIAVNPACWMAHLNLGQLLAEEGRTTEAMTHFQETLRLKPEYDEGHNNLGITLERQGRAEEAAEQYRAALRIDPDNVNARMNLANLLTTRGEGEPAIHHYREVIRRRPDLAAAHLNLGMLLARKGARPEAIEHFRAALRSDPTLGKAWLGLGMASAQEEAFEEAIDAYRQLLKGDPRHEQARLYLAIAYRDSGRMDEAIREFRMLLQQNPSHELARQLLEEIE